MEPHDLSNGPITVEVEANDPITQAGVIAQLRPRPEVRLLDEDDETEASVLVLVAHSVDEGVRTRIRRTRMSTETRTLLVVTFGDISELFDAAACGIAGMLRRVDASPEQLVHAICAVASGEGSVPGDLIGQLLTSVQEMAENVLAPRGLHIRDGFTVREINVLRLLAEGDDTPTIAQKLSFSERTIKNVVHAIMTRNQLRNRTQAVAFALRLGLI